MRAVSLLFHDVYVGGPRESGFTSTAADRYKLPLSVFEAQLARLADVCPLPPALATQVCCGANPSGSTHNRTFLITVDDGGVSYYSLVADRLEALGWRGHCFVTTAMIGQPGFLSAAQIRELDARGHVIGSHSVSHPPRFTACTRDRMRREWCDSRAALEDLLGHEVRVASLPGGYYSPAVAQTAHEAGLAVLFNSEPTTAVRTAATLLVAGRYTIRRGDHVDTARRLVQPTPWTRCAAWAAWNAKAVFKPVFGGSYVRVADWILGAR
ncbi:MAG: hypothetical protein A3F70_01490 [Acidobacteria bacterium RIFCSPLOWO2_12_FULL_67_14]|nr:MAG: hypothetical protein A3F70_01490 [Acidobacteria bacterium RIFCSPLOWO2_12_FULL_67_14]